LILWDFLSNHSDVNFVAIENNAIDVVEVIRCLQANDEVRDTNTVMNDVEKFVMVVLVLNDWTN